MTSIDRSHLERIELAFPALVGEHRVVERDLALDGRPLADWLAVGPGGALLVSVVDGASDEASLRALDGLAVVQDRPELLAAALEDDDLPVRVVLVGLEGFSELQLERLGRLAGEGLWLLRRRELASARGTHTRLEALDLATSEDGGDPVTLPAWALREPFHGFLARVSPDRLELALELVGRLRRVDSDLSWAPDGAFLECSGPSGRIASLSWIDGELRLESDEQSPIQRITDREGLDAAVVAVLMAHLSDMGDPAEEPLSSPRPRARLEVVQGSADDELPEVDEEEFPPHELQPLPPGPLLTPEEIQAFQE